VITVYSKSQCPNCLRAKELLTRKDIRYVEVDIEADDEAKIFLVDQGFRSVPQINVDGVFLEGGLAGLTNKSDDFFEAHKAG
jgi:glutaredoxin 3